MKKIIFIAAIACLMVACGNKKSEQNAQSEDSTAIAANAPMFELDKLLGVANQYIDQTIKVRGSVTHTCKHSGRRCFIVGNNENVTMRVEAKGNIGGFNRELIGSELEITGVLKEVRQTKEQIDEKEKANNQKAEAEDGSAESCDVERNNITAMREWMKANNKDYYATYYMNGMEYAVVENK